VTIARLRRHTAIAALLGAALALLLPAGALAQRAELVRIPFPQDDGSLTPYTFELGYPLVTLIYDTLTWRDANGVPRPWLARTIRRGEGGLTVTVELRRGVRWHDGRPLSADDVAFTFGYVARRPHPRFTPQLRDIASVEAVDRDTVVFRLERPSLGFLDQPLADVPILPHHLWEGLRRDQLAPPGPPVGSGPYRLVDHRRGERYRFEANRSYFRGEPLVRAIEVPIIRTADKTFDALRERKVDVIPASLTPQASQDLATSLGIRVVEGDSYLGTVLMFNTARPPFDSRQARLAVANVLDLTRIARSLSDRPIELPAVPAERGFLHPASIWSSRTDLHRFDEDAARVALAELGLPELRILAPRDDPLRVEAGRQVVHALRRAGARATLTEVSARNLSEAVGEDAFGASYEAAIWSSPQLASHDPAFLQAIFGSAQAPLNYSAYRSSLFDRLAVRASTVRSREARRRVIWRQLRLLAQDAPVVPLFFADGAFAYRPAAYDGWIYVKGTGIVDKRSFLPRRRASAHQPESPGAGNESFAESDDSGSLLGPFALVAIALLVGAVGWWTLAELRSRVKSRR
jgi:peptide/nickel transport system substrate-binding protein